MKKIYYYLILLLCLLLVLFSCGDKRDNVILKDDPSETDSTADDNGSSEIDLNKEISENYKNETVALEDVYKIIKFYENMPPEERKYGLTYYDLVKILGSTGVNTSDLAYRCEWRVDDGRYLHAKYISIDYDQPDVPADAKTTNIKLEPYTLDPQLIQSKYDDYSMYLYDSYYKYVYDNYEEFLLWYGGKNIPETDDMVIESPPEDKDEKLWNEYEDVPVDKIKALNVKTGMVIYDICVWFGSKGQSSSSGSGLIWKITDDFHLNVSLTFPKDANDWYDAKVNDIIYLSESWPQKDFSEFYNLCEYIYYS